MYKFLILLALFLVYSCSNPNDILGDLAKKQSFLSRSRIKDVTVYYRSRGRSNHSAIYCVNTFSSACSPMFVEISTNARSIVEINDELFRKDCSNTIDESKIEAAIYLARELGISFYKVDLHGNFYINKNKDILFIKDSVSSFKTNDYEKIDDNWYVLKESGVHPQKPDNQ